MAQVVEAQPAESGIGAYRPPARREAVGAPPFGVSWKQERLRVARAGQRLDERPRGFAERHGTRAGFRSHEIDGILADVAPAQIEHFAAAAAGERQQPHRGDVLRPARFVGVERATEPGQLVRVEEPGDVVPRVLGYAEAGVGAALAQWRERLLFRGGGGAGDGGRADRRAGEDPHPTALRPRSGARHPGAVPDEPGRRRRPLAQRRAPGGAQPGRRAQGRALRLDLRARRQGDADRERLRQGGLQRRYRHGRGCGPRGGRADRAIRGPRSPLRLRRARRAGAGLCRDGAQEPGLGIPGGGDPGADPALRDAEAEPALYRGHAGQAAGGAGGPEEGSGDRGAQRVRTPALVEAGRMAGRRVGRYGGRNRPRCPVSSGAAVDRRHALRVIGEQDRIGWRGRRTGEQGGDGRSAGSPNRPEQVGGDGGGGRRVRGHRRRTCQWRGSADCGIRDLRHQKQTGPYRTQSEDRRGGFDIGFDVADIQGREDAEGCRERESRVMTLQRQPTATGEDSDRLHVAFSRLPCDDWRSATRRTGAAKSQGSRGVDGWTATGLDAGSRMRQEGRPQLIRDLAFRCGGGVPPTLSPACHSAGAVEDRQHHKSSLYLQCATSLHAGLSTQR